jgi:hypothetical protein
MALDLLDAHRGTNERSGLFNMTIAATKDIRAHIEERAGVCCRQGYR